MDKEIWKDIKGYEGEYQVSNFGRVRSIDKYVNCGLIHSNKALKKGKILKLSERNGYLGVGLCNGKSQKSKLVHKLVAEAFIENPNNYNCVNHKDENKQNNCVNNLEWCSILYNNTYGNRLKKISKSLINNPKISKKVNQYDLNGRFIKQWESIMEVERQLDINNSNISSCCSNKKAYKSAGGYIWKYAECDINND